MATYTSILKPSSYITLDELAEWLAIDKKTFAIPSDEVKASKVIQDLIYTSKLIGTAGNSTAIQYTSGGTNGSEIVTIMSNTISVQIENGVSSANNIKNAIESHPNASTLVTITLNSGATGSEPQNTQVVTLLTGGVNAGTWAKGGEELRRLLERIINIACDKIENIIQTSVIAKTFEEYIDGNNSNVILPSKWPIVSIDEIKIDYNRNFGPETIIQPVNYILRGYADRRQSSSDVSLRVVGNDIVLRDDGKDSIVGKIFSGSVLGSVKIIYKAGWALSKEDIPFDLSHAATLLAEYYYYQRSNRDLGVTSKGIRGESYSKVKDGIPDTVWELVDSYKDISLPLYEKSQTNIFGV